MLLVVLLVLIFLLLLLLLHLLLILILIILLIIFLFLLLLLAAAAAADGDCCFTFHKLSRSAGHWQSETSRSERKGERVTWFRLDFMFGIYLRGERSIWDTSSREKTLNKNKHHWKWAEIQESLNFLGLIYLEKRAGDEIENWLKILQQLVYNHFPFNEMFTVVLFKSQVLLLDSVHICSTFQGSPFGVKFGLGWWAHVDRTMALLVLLLIMFKDAQNGRTTQQFQML